MEVFIKTNILSKHYTIESPDYITCLPFTNNDCFHLLYMRNDAAIPIDSVILIQIKIESKPPTYASVSLPPTTENIAIIPVNGIPIIHSIPDTKYTIPYKIIQTWRDINPHQTISHAISSIKSFNGLANHKFFDNVAQRMSIMCPRTLTAYDKLVPGAYRADVWRYYYLFNHGGIYIDAKLVQVAPFDYLLDKYDLIIVKDRNNGCIYNGFICVRPEHPLLSATLSKCITNIMSGSYGDNPLDITGPQTFGRCYNSMLGRDEKEDIQDSDLKIKILLFTGTKIVDPVTNQRLFKESLLGYREAVGGQALHYSVLYTTKAVYLDQALAQLK